MFHDLGKAGRVVVPSLRDPFVIFCALPGAEALG
jgi:hypothetical protein